jgi:hypothetical protein
LALYAFIGVAVTSATTIIYGAPIWDPAMSSRAFKAPQCSWGAMLALCIAKLATNIAANVREPRKRLPPTIAPKHISFRGDGYNHAGDTASHDAVKNWSPIRAGTFSRGSSATARCSGRSRDSHCRLLCACADAASMSRALSARTANFATPRLQHAGLRRAGLAILPNLPGFLVQVKVVAGIGARISSSAATTTRGSSVSAVAFVLYLCFALPVSALAHYRMKTPQLPPFDHVPQPYTRSQRRGGTGVAKAVSESGDLHLLQAAHHGRGGKGQYLFDEKGRRYLDAFAGIVTVSVGHCHPHVIAAANRQKELLQQTTTIYLNPNIAENAQALAREDAGRFEGLLLRELRL